MSREASFSQTLGIDLTQAAKKELEFLKLVQKYPNLCEGPVLKNAIRRYELYWLPFASRVRTDLNLSAPLDIEWVWHVHMLAPNHYVEDCRNILSKVLDHSLLNRSNREIYLNETKRFWRGFYGNHEPFQVDLAKPPTVLEEYRSKIQYNLEEACYRQFKFYYQVSLPHYSDDLFLKSAVERYEHHLLLKRLHPDVFHGSMVPCYDIELIWHAHQLHPLNYRQTITEVLVTPLHHDDTVRSRTPAANFYDTEVKTRALWEAAGLQFAKAGAIYRGDPPDPRPPTPWLYAPLACLKYSCEIQKIEVLGLKGLSIYTVHVDDVIFGKAFRGNSRKIDSSRTFILDNDTKYTAIVSLKKPPKTSASKSIAESQVDFRPYFHSVSLEDTTPGQPIVIDVPLFKGQYTTNYTTKLTVKIDPITVMDYCFKVQPEKKFVTSNHPSMILNYPELMLSPSDLANTSVPCDSSTHSVLWRGHRVFSYRVVHSSEALLSALEIINLYGQVVASAHTISPSTFPERSAVEDQRNNIFLNQDEGERAMLIRGSEDWGVCIAGLKTPPLSDEGATGWPYYVGIKVFKLTGERGWCSVQKARHGLFVIKLDSDTTVRVDLKANKVVISPRAQNIPQILALAFSISILHLLCIPYRSAHPSWKSSPSSQISHPGFISPSFYSAGYFSSKVPSNVYLSVDQNFSPGLETFEDRDSRYNFHADMFCDWNDRLLPDAVSRGSGRD